jgi:hypothetical protein
MSSTVAYNKKRSRKGRPADEVWKNYNKIEVVEDEESDPASKPTKKYECKHCGKCFSSPVSLVLKSHLSNSFYAKHYKTTLCPNVSSEIQLQQVNELQSRQTKDKRFHEDFENESQQKYRKTNLLESVHSAMDDFVAAHDLPNDILQSKSFLNLVNVIKNYAIASTTTIASTTITENEFETNVNVSISPIITNKSVDLSPLANIRYSDFALDTTGYGSDYSLTDMFDIDLSDFSDDTDWTVTSDTSSEMNNDNEVSIDDMEFNLSHLDTKLNISKYL